ncbi:siderophore-interacting protein [Galactobacter valiniphilus]|uniref:siderophore-interacting protein n=1 Tax=Galactobacter valiniphilus TaxID=2676122 RepID=UPI003736C84E
MRPEGDGARPARAARPARPQQLAEVVASERISEHLARLTLGGPGLAGFEPKAATDQYVKFLFADPALGLTPPFDLDAIRAQHGPEGVPVRRTYTVRAVRRSAAGTEIDVDFVVHGADGIAGPWAAAARPGDVVCFSGPGGKYAPEPGAWHLLAGDEAALPAIAAGLEAMGPEERGVAVLDVAGPGDRLELAAPAGVELRWVERGGEWTPASSRLEEAVRAVEFPVDTSAVRAFVHGERETMKSLRAYLVGERGLERSQLSLSAYWAYGRAEDAFQAEKREPIGKIFPEEA